MKREKEQGLSTPAVEQSLPKTNPKRPYQKPDIQSEPLFETVALGAAKLIDDLFCDQPTAS